METSGTWGAGGTGGREPGRTGGGDLFEGGKREQILKKHTRILFITVYHPVLGPVPI